MCMLHSAMTKVFLLVILALGAFAQTTPQFQFGPAVKGEMSVTFDLRGVGVTGTSLAAIQFSLPSPASPATMTIVPGAAATAASKTLSCAGNTGGRITCVLAAMNQTAIADGPLATVTVATPTIGVQTLTENIADLLGASAAANAIAFTVPTPVTISLTSRCDLNSDGKVDLSDLAGAIGQAQGVAACTTADITGRGKCDILDIQRIVNAGVGGTCKSGI